MARRRPRRARSQRCRRSFASTSRRVRPLNESHGCPFAGGQSLRCKCRRRRGSESPSLLVSILNMVELETRTQAQSGAHSGACMERQTSVPGRSDPRIELPRLGARPAGPDSGSPPREPGPPRPPLARRGRDPSHGDGRWLCQYARTPGCLRCAGFSFCSAPPAASRAAGPRPPAFDRGVKLRGGGHGPGPPAFAGAGQVRSGQVCYSAEVWGHESHKAASAASEESTGLYLDALE
jgi:hypothetical protein